MVVQFLPSAFLIVYTHTHCYMKFFIYIYIYHYMICHALIRATMLFSAFFQLFDFFLQILGFTQNAGIQVLFCLSASNLLN